MKIWREAGEGSVGEEVRSWNWNPVLFLKVAALQDGSCTHRLGLVRLEFRAKRYAEENKRLLERRNEMHELK